MIGSDSLAVERKVVAILGILSKSSEAIGARVIARQLKKHGIDLTERAVRYHLKSMDERGLTHVLGREGRLITSSGVDELRNALVDDKVSLVVDRIKLLAYRTTFDWQSQSGTVPVNISLFTPEKFPQALEAMRPAFEAGICVSDLVATAEEGEEIGEMIVPQGKVALATVCSTVVNGALLKAGIPIDSRFGGLLQIRGHRPFRFVELIYYGGSSLEPSEVFIKGRMTRVTEAISRGDGNVLADFGEIPAPCRLCAETVITRLKEARLGNPVLMGNIGEPVCKVAVEPNRVGIVILDGLNPVAAAQEAGIEAENTALTSVVHYGQLRSFWKLWPLVSNTGDVNTTAGKMHTARPIPSAGALDLFSMPKVKPSRAPLR
jgi:hypothetical protein